MACFVAVVSVWQTATIPLHADFSHLLPPAQESVRDLERLQKRAQSFGAVFVVVESEDPALRARTVERLAERFRTLDPDLVSVVEVDDETARRFFWDNRFLFVDLADLERVRDALADQIRRAKLDANPLYISLEDGDADDDDDADADDDANDDADADDTRQDQSARQLDALRKRFDDAEAKTREPTPFVSRDGRMQFLSLRSTFPTSDMTRAKALVAGVERVLRETGDEMGPEVSFGVTGTVVSALDEYRAIVSGMTTAALVTIILCALALFLYYRSVLAVGASLFALGVGVLATFAFTKLAIGYFNLMSAFLVAIVVGNGVNAGLILLARYFEELRAGHAGNDALARAIAGACHGTMAASLTASVAYGSLMITNFRGFRHFGVIAGVGMLLCWVAAFTVLPAALCVLRRRGLVRVGRRPPVVGRILAALVPRDPRTAVAIGLVVALLATVVAVRYVASDPYLQDWRELRSHGPDITAARKLDERMKQAFDNRFFSGLTQRFVIALDRREDVRPLVDKLRAQEKTRPQGHALLSEINNVDDFLPAEQPRKLAVLRDIRRMLDDNRDEFTGAQRRDIERFEPPAKLSAITLADVPPELVWPFTEKDNTVGRLIFAKGDKRFESWNVTHRVEFANQVRRLELPDDALVGGQSFVIADIIESVELDGPLAIMIALVGSVFAVWIVVGLRRHGAVTLLCGLVGIVGMLAMCAVFDIKVHFLDLIALPITIGIGIDYAVNLAVRERQDWRHGARGVLATTGGAVLLCSFTTIVGYGSLLLSNNGGVQSFGLAAILGEFTCLFSALFLAPSLLQILRARADRRGATIGE